MSEWWGGSSAVDAAIRSFVRSKEAVRRRTHTGPYRRRQKRRRRCWQLNWLTEHSSGSSSGECARSVIYSGWEGGLLHMRFSYSGQHLRRRDTYTMRCLPAVVTAGEDEEQQGQRRRSSVDCVQEIDKFSATCPFAKCVCEL